MKYNFKIIEDASHAIGGKYDDEPVGNCNYSDITVLSFHPVKIITSGEGGMALTNSEELSKKIINILTMDDDRLNQIRKYAAKRVINEFNLEFQSQLFRDFYY